MKYMLVLCLGIISMAKINAQEFVGRVLDSESNAPIPFATVYVIGTQSGVVADSLGRFEFYQVLPDVFDVKVSAEFYETRIIHIHSHDKEVVFVLEPSHLDMGDVIVSSPSGGLSRTNAFKIDRLELNSLNSIRSSNLSEAISNMNGVQSASLGAGISKPVIRGMQGLRVLTLINGVRLDNQQWGGDHGMAVGQLGIGAVELIKGPSSLLYGSDAFGGVIYLADAPYAANGKQKLDIGTQLESVNGGMMNTLNYGISRGALRLNVSGMYSSYADYQLPNGKYLQNSRFSEYGGKASLGYSKRNWVSHLRYTYANSRVGIPGHSHDSIPNPIDFQVDSPERSKTIPVQFQRNHILTWENKFFIKHHELQIIAANTLNNLTEFEEKVTIPGLGIVLNNTILNLRYTHVFNDRSKFVSGYQGLLQLNNNDSKALEELIPDYTQLDNGLYSIFYTSLGEFDIQAGARLDYRSLSVQNGSTQKSYLAPNFSTGFVRAVKNHVIRMNVSSGFRPPHVSELLSDGVHHGTLRYEKGDTELKSEYSVQTDISYEFEGEHLSLVFNPFYNWLNNYIVIDPTDSLIDGLPVFQYTQIEEAYLYGVDFGVHYHPHFAHLLHFESSYSYVRAHDRSGESLSLIPQARINTVVKLDIEMKGKFRLENIVLQHQYYFDQSFVSEMETASDDYHLINLGINGRVGDKRVLKWSFGVKNALNENYINHLSRLKNIETAHPARNFYIGINYEIPSF